DAGAQFVVMGEGEGTMEELLRAINAGVNPSKLQAINGIAYLDDRGTLRQTQPRAQMPDLDAQPWPARHMIDIPQYVKTWRDHHGKGSVNFITARGCPFRCRWCSHQVYGQSHRRRNPLLVVDEVEWLLKEYTPDQV